MGIDIFCSSLSVAEGNSCCSQERKYRISAHLDIRGGLLYNLAQELWGKRKELVAKK